MINFLEFQIEISGKFKIQVVGWPPIRHMIRNQQRPKLFVSPVVRFWFR